MTVHIDDYPVVCDLHKRRDKLLTEFDRINDLNNEFLGVTINGNYQDQEFVLRVRPVVATLLKERIAKLEMAMRELGVDFEPRPEE